MTANRCLNSPPGRVALAGAVRNGEWDAFVAGTPGGDLAQTTAWAATKQALGLETDLVVIRDASGVCVGGGLLVIKRIRAGIAAAYVARGPVADQSSPWASTLALDAIIDRARSLHVSYLIVQPPEGGQQLDEELLRRGFQAGAPNVAPSATIRLDLARSDEQLLLGMRKRPRYHIRRSLREEIDISSSLDVDLFHHLHTATAARQGFEPRSLAYLEHQWAELAPTGRLMILVAHYAGRPVSGLWLTSFNGIVTFRLAGWDSSVPSPKYVNEALHWNAIQRARCTGARLYDFGGFDREIAERLQRGEPPAHFVRTHDLFKLQFGGPPILFPQPRFFIFNRLVRFTVTKTGLLAGRRGYWIADRFRNG
ncbi:MAG: peptidoglycan bridge formation glycyltransferase FemA/FemB family protein [Actinomycetota bacterium]|nr:peptidoglycan bridge formation glycyltransferase FemA/FemB family protein [Actinomycetota bacterium]